MNINWAFFFFFSVLTVGCLLLTFLTGNYLFNVVGLIPAVGGFWAMLSINRGF